MGDYEYPTEQELKQIREWNGHHPELMEYVKSLWWMPDWGWSQDGTTYDVSTGGWSGNESLIDALQDNFVFWTMSWVQSRVGGHYILSCKMPQDFETALQLIRGVGD